MDASGGPVNREPTNLELRELERIVDRRAELEAAAAGDERRTALRRLLVATLDEMEEALCLYGRRAAALAEGWRRLAHLTHLERPGGAGRET